MTNNIKRLVTYIGTILVFLAVIALANAEEKSIPVKTLDVNETIVLRGTINFSSSNPIIQRILRADNNPRVDTIFLVLDSGGGSIVAGNSIIAAMKSLEKPIVCIAIFAASMAHGIMQHCDVRFVTEDGVSMIHRARGRFGGYFNNGEVESQLKLWKAIVTKMEKKNASRMGYSYKEYQSLAANEFWCQGDECVKNRFVDHIINIRCTSKLLQSKYPIRSRFGETSGYLSGCPLIRGIIK